MCLRNLTHPDTIPEPDFVCFLPRRRHFFLQNVCCCPGPMPAGPGFRGPAERREASVERRYPPYDGINLWFVIQRWWTDELLIYFTMTFCIPLQRILRHIVRQWQQTFADVLQTFRNISAQFDRSRQSTSFCGIPRKIGNVYGESWQNLIRPFWLKSNPSFLLEHTRVAVHFRYGAEKEQACQASVQ